MKKSLLILIFLCTTIILQTNAQNQTKLPDKVIDKMADDVCKCITTYQNENPNRSTSEYNEKFTSCFTVTVSDYINEILTYMSAEEFSAKGREIGIEVGKVLLKNCPAFVSYSIKMAAEKEKKGENILSGSVSGKVKRVEEKDFIYLILADDQGRENSFIWLTYFKGSDDLINGLDKIKGKKLTITWQEIECYLPKAKGYYKLKKITAIEGL